MTWTPWLRGRASTLPRKCFTPTSPTPITTTVLRAASATPPSIKPYPASFALPGLPKDGPATRTKAPIAMTNTASIMDSMRPPCMEGAFAHPVVLLDSLMVRTWEAGPLKSPAHLNVLTAPIQEQPGAMRPGRPSSSMSAAHVLYRSALRGLKAVSPLLSGGPSKLSRGLRGRRDSHEQLAQWGRSSRDPGQPTVWVHASSVGEALQARSVLEAVRERVPELQVAFTFFSPSAEAMASTYPADVTSYLPWDLPRTMGSVLDALRPSVLLFTQKEVWPTLTTEAGVRGVPTLLIAGTLSQGAGRLRWPARAVLTPAFASLAAVAAISSEDGERFGRLGVPTDRIVVTGDPGIDSAWSRASGVDLDAPHMRLFRNERGPIVDEPGPILIAGSTWESDEAVLFPALAQVRRTNPDLRLILAPHEPGRCDFEGLKRRLVLDGWTPTLLADAERLGGLDGTDAVLVERVGVLADLYAVATVAYVGGGFHAHGL
ncbi:MAG TPA: hypothetical protein EYQ27_15405, partial [Gemmatimonadetes bacterium]|nr:hypothetical protein [Gemmatimonadota bacterium]